MTNQQILQVIRDTGVLQEGHFRLTSGRHSDRYMQCARLFEYPDKSALLCAELGKRYAKDGVELVVAPALGGVILGYEVARALGARNIFAERQEGKMTLRRGFGVQPGARVLVVEDVITTGGSVREVLSLVRGAGASVVGVGVIVDRSGGGIDFGVRLESLLSMQIASYAEADCPLCKQGLPIVKPGSRVFAK